jgi:hypothetical protein
MTAVEISSEAAARLAAEAGRRGVSLGELASDVLSRNLPPARKHRYSFVGIGDSGRPGPLNLDEDRARLAARPISEL